ncbi:MAG: F0F1 ATP synthase subunit alpha [Ruminococcaceae bacterium]|nr:F0F1 ATP synthase subunit alpha [Oscillospiraceae bacterium]MBR3596463.1 F0F1 ATP synthase subunit alpha [Clostridia bacterium]
MEIQYVIINFLILVLILVIAGRKTVKRIFGTRRERVIRELDEALEIQSRPFPEFSEPVPEISEDFPEEIIGERTAAEKKLAAIYAFQEREQREIHRLMTEKTKSELMKSFSLGVKELFSKEPYYSKIREKEERIVDSILSQIKLTPGDMAYLKHHDVLYVTLMSAFPLDEKLVEKVDNATKELLATVNGKTSLWVREDPEFIGGLRLRIGDTVYDGTVSEELYHFGRRLNREPLTSDDTVKEITEDFLKTAKNFQPAINVYQLGRVLTVSDGICWMDGLADIMYGEVIEFERGERGMILDIQPDRIGCVIFGEFEHIESGTKVRRIGRIASVPVGNALLGRVVNAIGNPIDGEGHLFTNERRPIEVSAPAILDRAPVNSPLLTGIKAIDAMVPIGKGQRELIIGDRQTGKTAIAIDTIINQKGKNTVCIYVAIGQKESLISEIKETLENHGAMEYTTIISAPASESAALQYIAPFSGTAMAEYFMYEGKDVLIVYDDLSKHAVAYRELSLLLHRPSGREAYPGDIFYLHSRLLERSAHLSDKLGGGSLTALPIIETLAGDISAYIPTNVISITDGQIFLDSELFHEGQRPAINVGLSVSRVGGSAQYKLMKQVSSSLRTNLAQYRELQDFTQFGTDIDDVTKRTLDSGKRLMATLKQGRYQPLDSWKQSLILFAVSENLTGEADLEEKDYENGLFGFFIKEKKELTDILIKGDRLSDETKEAVREAVKEYTGRC